MTRIDGISMILRDSSLWRNLGIPIRDSRAINLWLTAGRPSPPPHPVKVRNILTLADIFDVDILVETGTFRGMMIDACLERFEEIHSIEIHRPLADDARRHFAPFPHVRVHEGDSGEVLPRVLSGLTKRALFWLDGHYSGEGTGRGADDSPIMRELASIREYRSNPNDDVILIDDARLFNGSAGYPLMSGLLNRLSSDFGVTPHVANDAIILLPAR